MTSSKFLLDSSREYAIYVCQNRAIPAITDGLKTGQRIALWLLRNKDSKIKTVALGGEMAATKLYVHGDVSANNAISLLAAPYKNNNPLIEGHGAFGGRLQPVDGIGAPRYTDIKRSKIAQKVLYCDLDIVPLMDNYDGSNKQPVHLLPLIPLVLLNGVSGIAVGWSTSVLPRSYLSIVDASIAALTGKKIKPMMPHYERYDVDVEMIGDNQYEITGKVRLIDSSTIQITELPPGVDFDKYLKSLDDLETKGVIVDFTDNSSDSVDIMVKFKRGSIAGLNERHFIDLLKIKEKTTERIVVIDFGGKAIATYETAEEVVKDFVEWRLGWYKTRYEKMVSDTADELTYWELLKVLFDGGFTKKLGTFADKTAMENDVVRLAKKAKLTTEDHHIDRVIRLPTYQWTAEFQAHVDTKILEYTDKLDLYGQILASPEALKAVYVDELQQVRKL